MPDFHIAQVTIMGDNGPEERFLGPFETEEELETFISIYDIDSDWYVKVIPPDVFIEELITIQ